MKIKATIKTTTKKKKNKRKKELNMLRQLFKYMLKLIMKKNLVYSFLVLIGAVVRVI